MSVEQLRADIDTLLQEWRVRGINDATISERLNYRRRLRNALLELLTAGCEVEEL